MVTLANELQSAKAAMPTWITELGMVTVAKELQPRKELCPISVTESGTVTLANEIQPLKAAMPMSVTELGMVTLANELQSAKAAMPIWITESGRVTLGKELHSAKALYLMAVTDLGMTNLANMLQPSKAPGSMALTSFGISSTMGDSKSIARPKRGKSLALEHLRAFFFKITVAFDSGEKPASASVSSIPSNWSLPTTTSIRVVLRVNSSFQTWRSLICCFSSRPVISGSTLRAKVSPLSCMKEISIAIGFFCDHTKEGLEQNPHSQWMFKGTSRDWIMAVPNNIKRLLKDLNGSSQAV